MALRRPASAGHRVTSRRECSPVAYRWNASRICEATAGSTTTAPESSRTYFQGVEPEVWEFHIGGYQVCDKWLKDRKGRRLSYDDIAHYQKIVVALRETLRLMKEIDEVIAGWPIE